MSEVSKRVQEFPIVPKNAPAWLGACPFIGSDLFILTSMVMSSIIMEVIHMYVSQGWIQYLIRGGDPDHDRPKLPMVHSSVVWVKQALCSMGSGARLRAPEALGYFITKYAFSPFWGTFLYYFWNNKILIFLDKLPWQTFLYTGKQILDQMYMYLFLKNYFLLKYQSIMHKNHNAMFMINVHFMMYNLCEPMKIKWSDAWIHICIRQWWA